MTAEYLVAGSLDEALDALTVDDSLAIAGGQAVVLLMNLGLLDPQRLVSLKRLTELGQIRRFDGELEIGCLVTHSQAARSRVVGDAVPGLNRVFESIGNLRVRNRGTLGGNLAHADPSQDPPVALAALDAWVEVSSRHRSRQVPVAELASGFFETTLAPGELLTRVVVPVTERTVFSYIRQSTTSVDDYPAVSVAACVQFDYAGLVASARLAFGAVGPTVIAGTQMADALVGGSDDPDRVRTMQDAVRDAISPTSDRRGSADYKRELAAVLVADALASCLCRRLPVGR